MLPAEIENYVSQLKTLNKSVTHVKVNEGGHYNSMVDPGISKGVSWLRDLVEKASSAQQAAQVPAFNPQIATTYTNLALRSIGGPVHKRLAMINNQTFAPGETAKVKLGDKFIVLECKEIRDDSVIVRLEDEQETRELKLANKKSEK